MGNPVVVDTGPLVALLDRRDTWHGWSVAALKALHEPLLTCEAVLSEASFLLAAHDPGCRNLMRLFSEGIVRLRFDAETELPALAALLEKYRDTPMSYADACLVRMSEQMPRASVFTLDSDFRRYRRFGRQAIPLVIPD